MQARLLNEAEAFSRHWFQRRNDAIETAADALHQMNSNGAAGPAEALRAMADWQRRSLERLGADAQGVDHTLHARRSSGNDDPGRRHADGLAQTRGGQGRRQGWRQTQDGSRNTRVIKAGRTNARTGVGVSAGLVPQSLSALRCVCWRDGPVDPEKNRSRLPCETASIRT